MRVEADRGTARASAAFALPDLRVVPSPALHLHEDADPARVARLARTLAADGVLRNPPIAAALDPEAYVVLDGANRVTALAQAGMPHQMVQVVDYDDPGVRLDVWAHLLYEDGPVVTGGGDEAGWRPVAPEALQAGLDDGTWACGLITPQGASGLAAPPGLADRIRLLAELVARYKGRRPIYRVQPAALDALAREYGRAEALVLFPRLTKQDVRAIARLPVKLPSGISRHVVPQRALRVNVDLALLRGDEATAAKQARLDELVRDRLLEHRVRLYPEATVLYDE